MPTLGANKKAALCLPECSQCIQFPVQRARPQKQKQTGSEGTGKWEVTEVMAGRAQMGNGGMEGDSGGGWGEEMDNTWFMLVTDMHVIFFFLTPHSNIIRHK